MALHTSKNYEQELTTLREKILVIGGKVEEMLEEAMKSLIQADEKMAKRLIESDREINQLEKEIDGLCFNILALRQPTASDLRFIITSLKIVTDLERMGDLGVNISERAIELVKEPPLKPYIHLPMLAQMTQRMIRQSLDAFVKRDVELARSILTNDDLVDDLTRRIFDDLLILMKENPENISRAIRLTFVAKYLERAADHATNVAEMVLFMLKGEDVRHPFSGI